MTSESAKSSFPNVLFVAHNPSGGAGLAALRQYEALKAHGLPVRFLVLESEKPGIGAWDEPVWLGQARGWHRKLGKGIFAVRRTFRRVLNWLRVLWQDSFLPNTVSRFEIVTLKLGTVRLESHPWFKWAEVVHVHWVAGFLSPRQQWDKKAWILTLHDCYPFTAVCHFPGPCTGYESGCKSCPQLTGSSNPSLSRKYFLKKLVPSRENDRVVVHAPSRWIAEASLRSLILGGRRTVVLPYFYPDELFRQLDAKASRDMLGLSEGRQIGLFVAADVSNTRKGFEFFARLAESMEGENWQFVIVGGGPVPRTPRNCISLGRINDIRLMAAVYSSADVFVTTSLQDNLPQTVVEAQLCGTPVVGFSVGGQPEMIDQGTTGWLSASVDLDGLKEGVQWWSTSKPDRKLISQRAHDQWGLKATIQRWTNFYHSESTRNRAGDVSSQGPAPQ